MYELTFHLLQFLVAFKIDGRIANYVAGYICIKTAKKNNSLVLIASEKHLQTDIYSTTGIIIGLVLLYYLKWWWIDSGSILFAFIIMFTGYKIIRTSVSGIMDETDEILMNKMVLMLNVVCYLK